MAKPRRPHRNRVKGTPRTTVEVPTEVYERLSFLGSIVEKSVDEALTAAIVYWDRAVCAAEIERAQITCRHRSGGAEDFNP